MTPTTNKTITINMTAAEAETMHRLATQCFTVGFHTACHGDAGLRILHRYALAAYAAERDAYSRMKKFDKKHPRLSVAEAEAHPKYPTTERVLAKDRELTVIATVLFGLVTAGSGYDKDDFMTGLKVWKDLPDESRSPTGWGLAKCVSNLKVRIVKEVKG